MNLKIIIISVIAVIAAVHFVATSMPNYKQVSAIEVALPSLSEAEAIDFYDIESALAHVEFDQASKPVLNSSTESVLSLFTPYVLHTAEPEALARIRLLVGKQFARREAKHFSDLLERYARYERQLAASGPEPLESSSIKEAIAHFKARTKIQNDIFGIETATALYGELRNLARYIYSQQLVEQNELLSEQQKQEQLDELSEKFQQRVFVTESIFQ